MKKILYLMTALLCVGLLMFAMSGCSNSESDANDTAVETQENANTTETTNSTEETDPTEETINTKTDVIIEDNGGEGSGFVSSVTYKGAPAVINATMSKRVVKDCVVVTTVEEAADKVTDITQEERDLLLDVFKKLSDGTMTLLIEGDYVIRDFVDVSFKNVDCRQKVDHNEKHEKLAEENVILTLDFELNVAADAKLMVLTYVDGEWKEIESVTNHGNGIVTCEFENVCPVAFVVLN